MDSKTALEFAKRQVIKRQKQYHDLRYQTTIGVLVAKGLLLSNLVKRNPSARISVADALWVGEHLEPRVLEVLPALMLRFPRTVINREETPTDLLAVLNALLERSAHGPDLRGVPYQAIKRWMDLDLSDKRTTKWSKRKVVRSFRILPAAASRLEELAKEKNMSLSQCLEDLILHTS